MYGSFLNELVSSVRKASLPIVGSEMLERLDTEACQAVTQKTVAVLQQLSEPAKASVLLLTHMLSVWSCQSTVEHWMCWMCLCLSADLADMLSSIVSAVLYGKVFVFSLSI